jgi:hypothetical protein
VYNEHYPEHPVTDVLFKNMLTRARQMLGMGQPGEVSALRDWFDLHGTADTTGDGPGYAHIGLEENTNVCDKIFFMSGSMKRAFINYGQFFNLDATCKTNRFGMQLIMLVGSNQIFGNAIFGMALVYTESIDTYTWVLEHLKRAVGQSCITHTRLSAV